LEAEEFINSKCSATLSVVITIALAITEREKFGRLAIVSDFCKSRILQRPNRRRLCLLRVHTRAGGAEEKGKKAWELHFTEMLSKR